MPRIRYEDMTPDEQDDWHDLRENDRKVRQDNEWERKVADKPDRAEHFNRKVPSERFQGGIHDPAAYSPSPWTPGPEQDDNTIDREMETRSRLEDEYGGGAGDWDH